jgi:hypothetical protein
LNFFSKPQESSMTTIFSAPTIGDPRATGIKNGGIKAFESDIVYPVSRLVNNQFASGKQMEFRWRSDSNRFWSPRDTKLYVKYQLMFGQKHGGATNGAPLNYGADEATRKSVLEAVRHVRLTAAPNTALFDGGMRYLQNSVVVENQTKPYTAAMAQLLTSKSRSRCAVHFRIRAFGCGLKLARTESVLGACRPGQIV